MRARDEGAARARQELRAGPSCGPFMRALHAGASCGRFMRALHADPSVGHAGEAGHPCPFMRGFSAAWGPFIRVVSDMCTLLVRCVQVCGRSACRSCTPGGTGTTASSCTTRTRPATTPAGVPPASAPTTRSACASIACAAAAPGQRACSRAFSPAPPCLCLSQAAISILKQSLDSPDEISLDKALAIAVKVLSKTMDSTTLTADKRTHGL